MPIQMGIETAEKATNPTDPVYFGGTGSWTFGVESSTNFVGCLQQIEYNKVRYSWFSIIQTLVNFERFD